jgi:hypothetical protein
MIRSHFYPVDERLPGSNTCLFNVTTDTHYDVLWESWSCCGAGGFAYTRTGPVAGPTGQDCTPFTKSGEDRIVVNGPCSLEITIDIKPGCAANTIDPFGKGLVPVAILGSDTFETADVDVTTLSFGPDRAAPAFDLRHPLVYLLSHRDVNHDDRKDLLPSYWIAETGIAMGDTEACLSGQTLDGMPFEGCDSLTTVAPPPGCGLSAELALLLPPLMWLYRRRSV